MRTENFDHVPPFMEFVVPTSTPPLPLPPMLTSPSAHHSSTDLGFFSKPASIAACSPSFTVTTRHLIPHLVTKNITPVPRPDSPLSSASSSSVGSVDPARATKRKFTPALSRQVKRLRTDVPSRGRSSPASSRGSSRQRTAAPSPEPIYRSSRSQSASVVPPVESPVPRQYWIQESGEPGPGFISSESVVKTIIHSYQSFFRNPNDPADTSYEPHSTKYPVAELEYPNTGSCESFILLAPKDKDHYNPIYCLEQSLYTMLECYLTPAQQSLFGTIPNKLPSDITPPPTPAPSPPNSKASSLSSLSTDSATSISPNINYLRSLQRAIHRHDGPLFHVTLTSINSILRTLKYPALPSDPFIQSPPNVLREAVRSWTQSGIPRKVLMRIIDETYQRCVGPQLNSLKNYEAFSSEVYGELMPSFVADIIATTGLNQNSLFVDLGSGVGNVVCQASLQSGCKSFGIEIMPAPARVAREQLEQIKIRCRMWGVAIGDVELEGGDMLQSQRLSDLIPKADVILVNNKVFQESLNEALRIKFLDLKEGALVVSLRPFVSSLNARLTERNVDDMSAIFDVTEQPYRSGSVSWGSGGGFYYTHRVDRKGYAEIRERFESMRSGPKRGGRSRR